jgi:carboxymethylenebutenolidase
MAARAAVLLSPLALISTLAACAPDDHTTHAAPQTPQSALFTYPENDALPPGADRAEAAIERSPRHGEWVDVANPGGPAIRTWVVYPERSGKAPVVLVIHTISGLSPWARALADQLAQDGFIAVAPDFLSGVGPNGGGTDAFETADEARKAMSGIAPGEAMKRLDAVRAYALTVPSGNGKTATMGFCWGGSRSFEYAVHQPALDAAVVFYGSSPEETAGYARIRAPIIGFYGGDDARVNETIGPAAAELTRLGKIFEHEIYEGAGHGFVGSQADRNGANFRATEKAWPRAVSFLKRHLD